MQQNTTLEFLPEKKFETNLNSRYQGAKKTLTKKRKECSRSFIVWNLETPKPSLIFSLITCFVKKFRDLSRMQYGQTIIGKYSSHFLATKQYKMAGAKFVSGTLLPENIYLFQVIEGHSFLKHVTWLFSSDY